MMMFIALMQAAVNWGVVVAPLAAALVVFGAAMGISKIGSTALDAIARQPETASNVLTTTIVSAALIEGASLFAIVICLMAVTA